MDHEIEGKSATTWLKWGSEFPVKLIKGQSEVMVEIYDLSPVPDDHFIKDLYAKFSKHNPSSPLKSGVVDRVSGVTGKLDKRKDLVMPREGTPDMEADITYLTTQAAKCSRRPESARNAAPQTRQKATIAAIAAICLRAAQTAATCLRRGWPFAQSAAAP
jgi:hypothetical protein